MKSVQVKMCCHGSHAEPKFQAVAGDAILVRIAPGQVRELVIKEIHDTHLNCEDHSGDLVNVEAGEILAVLTD